MSLPTPDMFDEWADWANALVQELSKPVAYAPKEAVGRTAIFKTAVSSGFLLCNGSAFSENTYPSLFQFLGTNVLPNLAAPYGVGYVVGIKT